MWVRLDERLMVGGQPNPRVSKMKKQGHKSGILRKELQPSRRDVLNKTSLSSYSVV